jgi:diguanylate cyclase (GGDEF)-like protein
MRIKSRYAIIIFIFISFITYSNILPQSDDNYITEESITEILHQTEGIRISDVNLYSANLAKLKSLQEEMKLTTYQHCYYQYLVAYDQGYKGNYQLAKTQLKDIYNRCENPENKIRSKLLLANLQVISQEYENAINNLDYTITNIGLINNIELKHRVYSIAALIYRLVDQNQLSLKFAELLINDNPTKSYMCDGLVAKYRIQLKLVDYKTIEDKIQQTLKICEKSSNYILSNFLRLEWLNLQLEEAKTTGTKLQILAELKNAEIEINKAKYQNLISIKDSIFARAYWILDDYATAADYAKRSLEGSKGIGSTKQKIVSLQVLVDYYQKTGDPEKAIEYLIEKNKSEKFHYNDKQAKTMAYQTIRHENLAKSHQIDFLNQRNQLLSLENELADKAALVQQLVIFFLIVLVAFFVLWGIRHKKIQKVYKNLSERDHMTLIYNRKGLRDYMDYLMPFSEQNYEQISFAIFDLDLFKNVNDKYGHITGDWVIKNVIQTCKDIGNEKVTLGRLGGEEFAIILRDSSMQELESFCEECRTRINNINTSDSGYDFKISASFGITSSELSGYTYSTILTHADEALYQAKNSGRNKTIKYRPT